MYLSDSTLDDLLRRVFARLLKSKNSIHPTRGSAREISGVLLRLTNPRARLSRTEKKGKVFSCLGELLWYLAKSRELSFIGYYIAQYRKESEDGMTVHGAYGPRLFAFEKNDGEKVDQIKNIIELLKRNRYSRRAVIQLFDATDIAVERKEVPCTCTLQFMVRGKRLHMFVSMRSNDAYFGLPHDVFAFTMLQEIIARSLNLELGFYKHFVCSLHLYENNVKGAEQFLKEGLQTRVTMPPMPAGDPWKSVSKLIHAERVIRNGHKLNPDKVNLHRFWTDIIRLLLIYRVWRDSKKSKKKEIDQIKKRMSTKPERRI